MMGRLARTPVRSRRAYTWSGVLSALVICGVSASTASGYAALRTPGQAVYCGWSVGEGAPSSLICWTPNDGYTISMRDYGRASRGRYVAGNRRLFQNRAPVLRFGRSMTWGPTVCTSRSTGLTCINGSGHGWWLGRYRGVKRF